jgi:hypothetical protein
MIGLGLYYVKTRAKQGGEMFDVEKFTLATRGLLQRS